MTRIGPLCAALGLLAVAACSEPPPRVSLDDLPIPAGAEQGPMRGAAVTRLDLATVRMRDDLREFGAAETEALHLDTAATWAEVEPFYADAFATPPLSEAGFERTLATSGAPDRYRLAVWTRGDDALAVAMIPGRPDDPAQFLVLLRAPAPSAGRR